LRDAKRRSQGLPAVKVKTACLQGRTSGQIQRDAVRGTRADADTHYSSPKGGDLVDSLCIPKAPHRDMAEKFINYILDPR
jgi:spermidine/putrescine-binding protein